MNRNTVIKQQDVPDCSADTHEVVCVDDYRAWRALCMLLSMTIRVDVENSDDNVVYRTCCDAFGRQMGDHVMFADPGTHDAGTLLVPVHLTTPKRAVHIPGSELLENSNLEGILVDMEAGAA